MADCKLISDEPILPWFNEGQSLEFGTYEARYQCQRELYLSMNYAQYRRWLNQKRKELASLEYYEETPIFQKSSATTIAIDASQHAAELQLHELMREWGESAEVSEVDRYLVECLGALSPKPDTLTVQQAADSLGVSKETIYAACKDGRLPHTRIGRRIVITPEQLSQYRQAGEVELPHLA